MSSQEEQIEQRRKNLEALGQSAKVAAAIGPGIGPCCYEVDLPVIDRFQAAYPSLWERWVRPVRPGHWMLDLWRAVETLLQEEGVRPERILNPRLCTACHPELFFSHRRDRGVTGRQGVIGLVA